MLSACAGKGTRPEGDPLAALERNARGREALSGTLFLTSNLSGKSQTVPAVMLVQWPDRLRIELQDPVGSLLALLVVDGDRFWLYRASEREILTGPLSRLPKDTKIPVAASDLVRVFLARPYVERMRQGKIEGEVSVFEAGGTRETVSWSKKIDEPLEWRQELAGGASVSVAYDEYEAIGGVRFPRKIRLQRGEGKEGESHLLLVWREWEPSVPSAKNLFQIPQQQTFGRKIKALP